MSKEHDLAMDCAILESDRAAIVRLFAYADRISFAKQHGIPAKLETLLADYDAAIADAAAALRDLYEDDYCTLKCDVEEREVA